MGSVVFQSCPAINCHSGFERRWASSNGFGDHAGWAYASRGEEPPGDRRQYCMVIWIMAWRLMATKISAYGSSRSMRNQPCMTCSAGRCATIVILDQMDAPTMRVLGNGAHRAQTKHGYSNGQARHGSSSTAQLLRPRTQCQYKAQSMHTCRRYRSWFPPPPPPLQAITRWKATFSSPGHGFDAMAAAPDKRGGWPMASRAAPHRDTTRAVSPHTIVASITPSGLLGTTPIASKLHLA